MKCHFLWSLRVKKNFLYALVIILCQCNFDVISRNSISTFVHR
nr:MAG TPA: hypothetical protein [Caudoviricetes sp.]